MKIRQTTVNILIKLRFSEFIFKLLSSLILNEMKLKKTKIIATLGPASCSIKMIEKLVEQGVNIFRINASHGDLSEVQKLIKRIRTVENKIDSFLGVLIDLQGPKIRIGEFENGFIEIHQGDEIVFTTESGIEGTKKIVPVQYKKFHLEVKPGNRVLLDDGNLLVIVKEVSGKRVTVEVKKGGTLSNHKGLNLPEASISQSPITKKDKEDLSYSLKCGVDFVALSFVKDGSNIRALRALIKKGNSNAKIIAKVERHEAINNLDEIIKESDGIMVARGDMGVEISFERVPIVQKDILRRCSKVGKPVIIATQMMESMIHHHRPTRAEVSDISNGVSYYSDALMLSAETAVGTYPAESVGAMARTALLMEEYQYKNHKILPWWAPPGEITPVTHGITYATNQLAESLNASAIIVFTMTGETARHVAKPRPNIPIFAFTADINVARQLTIIRNVNPFLMKDVKDLIRPLRYIFDFLKKKGFIQINDRVILTSGLPLNSTGNTNMIRVETVR